MSSCKKMDRYDTTDTKIQVVDDEKSDKIGSNVIECNVNMNVSLSSANRRCKIFQKAQSLFVVIIAILFAVVCFHLKREVRALEVQIGCMNTNLMTLMLRYEKLNKNFNRIWYHRLANHHRYIPDKNLSSKRFNENPTEYRRASLKNESASSFNTTNERNTKITNESISRENSTGDYEKLKENGENIYQDDNMIDDGRTMDDRQFFDNPEKDRYERAIVAFGRRSQETTTLMPGSRDDLSDDTQTWNESRTGRYRRDEGRGKKRRKIKRRLKRSRRRLGPLIATFVGAVPEQHVTDTVYIGPWVKSSRNESRYAFNKFHLVEDRTSIEVTANGLYMISAQIYYFGEPTHYSYWILLSSEGTSNTRKIIKCATVSAVSASEASCYTSVVLPLRRGDRLHIQQQERDRLINLREGHSYVQIMLLSNESPRRRGS